MEDCWELSSGRSRIIKRLTWMSKSNSLLALPKMGETFNQIGVPWLVDMASNGRWTTFYFKIKFINFQNALCIEWSDYLLLFHSTRHGKTVQFEKYTPPTSNAYFSSIRFFKPHFLQPVSLIFESFPNPQLCGRESAFSLLYLH